MIDREIFDGLEIPLDRECENRGPFIDRSGGKYAAVTKMVRWVIKM